MMRLANRHVVKINDINHKTQDETLLSTSLHLLDVASLGHDCDGSYLSLIIKWIHPFNVELQR